MYQIIFFAIAFLLSLDNSYAQELYVSTEPASNMASRSVGIRLANEGMINNGFKNRTNLEVMTGVSKNLMLHGNAYFSDFYQDKQKFEGLSFYGKYRFLSIDSVKKHFRGAFFAKYSFSNDPLVNDEISLEGDNSGIQGGVVFTKLLHKLAVSGSGNYTYAFDNQNYDFRPGQARQSIGYTLSGGYLLFPKTYTSYKQTNVNLYIELLGKTNPGKGQNLMDLAPAIQFIINSTFRIDLSQRIQLWNNMQRTAKNMYLVRLEYNFFNVY
ncbi:hypothetical protein GS399_01365 [Pedobacter sp. HMF7647]|uniref:Uncharacterized protein n=1 Tax=Hufsiella arboris TaxID=2695275 RepID=A0A7K1Y4U9_9SPHI|nr:hypothetical protein [Hufsiella arboris]MXV49606.1 hypothetical protein [Hufsiella arboris]